MWWIITIALIVVGGTLVWWSSGRAKPRMSLSPEEAHRRSQGDVATYRASHQTGPGPIGGGGGS